MEDKDVLEDQEQQEEARADHQVGFQDRLECEVYTIPEGADMVLSKSMTPERMFERLKAVRAANRKLGPGWERGWNAAHSEIMEAQKHS